MIDMERTVVILEILKEEYGITTEKELNEAIKRQRLIDITPFCAPPRSVLQSSSHSG